MTMSSINFLVASDLHGGNEAFRKLLTLADKVRPDALIVPGDWSGKRSVFVHKSLRGTRFNEKGKWGRALNEGEAARYARHAKNNGGYIIEADDQLPVGKELKNLENLARAQRLTKWLDVGAERIGKQIPLFTIPGNDDSPEVVNVLSTHPWPVNLDCDVEEWRGLELFGLGYSNETLWKTERELPDPEVKVRLNAVGSRVRDFGRALGLVHVPPYGTDLDLAPEVAKGRDGEPRLTGRGPVHVGSESLRDFICERAPRLVLSGHVHESKGVVQVSRSTCVNPGSAYHVGMIWAYLVNVPEVGPITFQPLRR